MAAGEIFRADEVGGDAKRAVVEVLTKSGKPAYAIAALTAGTGGGGGDASAANQVITNTKLDTLTAKQPALGTAGTASADVISVQGIAAGTPLIIGGNVADAVADAGSPVKTGGQYLVTPPTYADGQRGTTQLDSRGNTRVALYGGNTSTAIAPLPDNADAVAASGSSSRVGVVSRGTVFNGTTWDRQRGDTGGIVTQPHAMSASRWGYAAASGGITNSTTAVTIAPAAGAGLCNYVTSIQIHTDALGAATEIAIRDGAGGAVLWRAKINMAGFVGGYSVPFPVPLKGTANTLVEVVTLTASVTGSVYFNAQGFKGV